MAAFEDELSKEAGWTDTVRRVASRGASAIAGSGPYGRRLAVGAGIGAIGGGVVDEESPVRGALTGAALGAGVTGGAILATPAGREAAQKGMKHFLQRQRYSLTGGGVKNLQEARDIGLVPKRPVKSETEPGMISRLMGRSREDVYKRSLGKVKAEEEAFGKGYTHVPGIVRHPIEALKSGWKRSSMPVKALTGLGAYEAGKGFIQKPEEGGPGRAERGLRALGSTAGMIAAPAVFSGGMLVSEGLGQAGKWLGRGADRVAGRVKPPAHDTAVQRPGRETAKQVLGVT